MKKLVLILGFLLMASTAWGAACESITVADTAIGPTAATITPSSHAAYGNAFCEVSTAHIRYRTDGTDPTASVGIRVQDGQGILITDFEELRNFEMIRVDSTSATVFCCYW